MRPVRYIVVFILFLCCICNWGQDDFNPTDPPEPGLPPMRLHVVVSPSDAGSVSGSGVYTEGANVNLYAYTNSGFQFVSWTDSEGNLLSNSRNFTYVKGSGHETLTANYEFNPSAPAEPDVPETTLYYQLTLTTKEGGNLYGGGSYRVGEKVVLTAYPDNKFEFDGWYDPQGNKLSSDSQFTYTTTGKHVTIEGRFTFNPENPADPSEPILSYTVTASATDGGTVNFSSQRVAEGETISLQAYPNSGYIFKGWYRNGVLYSYDSYVKYTVTAATDQNFEARFEFSPNNPSDPQGTVENSYAIYLNNVIAKPNDIVEFPIYLSNVTALSDVVFQLGFAPELKPDLSTIKLSSTAVGYYTSYEVVNDTTYNLSFIGGNVPAGNTTFATLKISVPDNIKTAQGYPVKVSQVSVKKEDGNTLTASTRNGRISVYRLGDSNGDDYINVADLAGVSCLMNNNPGDRLIYYVSDMDGNEIVEKKDFDLLVDSILKSNIVKPQVQLARARQARRRVAFSNDLFPPSEAIFYPNIKQIVFPIRLRNRTGIWGFQFDMRIGGPDISTDENGDFGIGLAPGRTQNHSLSTISLGNGYVRVLCKPDNNATFTFSEEDVIYITLNVKTESVDSNLSVYMNNIVLTDAIANAHFIDDVSESVVVVNRDADVQGDINGDGKVDVLDVVALSNCITGQSLMIMSADVNGDGNVNVADIIQICNMINVNKSLAE